MSIMYNNQLNILLLSLGLVQGLLLAALLYRNRSNKEQTGILVLYLLILLFQILMKIGSKGWLMTHLEPVYFISYDLPFLYGPLVYLYLRSGITGSPVSKPVNLLHAAPFLIAAMPEILKLTSPAEFFTPLFILPRPLLLSFQFASLFVYHWLGFRLLTRQNNEFIPEKTMRWMRQFNTVSFLVTSLIAFALYFMYVNYPRHTEIRYLFAGITVFIYWISWNAMQMPQNGVEASSSKKYVKSNLKTGEASRVLDQLGEYMEREHPYLDSELCINDLAAGIGTNRHHLSQVLNEKLGRNFYDYINGYRIRTALNLLQHPDLQHLKIAAIAYDSGFNSLSTFNETFKKMTGKTPSEYRKVRSPEHELMLELIPDLSVR